MKMPVYLDNNATTPIDPRVSDAMLPFFTEQFGNASSANHAYGRSAKEAVESSREKVAQLIGCKSQEIIFTSGATESNNLAILGYLFNYLCPTKIADEMPHFITSSIEHKAVFEVGERLRDWGCQVTFLQPDKYGQVSVESVNEVLQPNTKLVSVMWANNEVGTINPVTDIATLCEQNNVLFHCDAAQAVGKIPMSLRETNIDLLSLSAHKMYGPKGVGALYIREKTPEVKITPFTVGGSQEKGIRPGTLNVPGIVGLGEACSIFSSEGEKDEQQIVPLQKKLIETIQSQCSGVLLNGHPTERLYNNVSFSFSNVSADAFPLGLSGLALSSGSACSSKSEGPSYVLKGIGRTQQEASATIRIGLGRFNTEQDVELALDKIIKMHKRHGQASA